MANELDDKTLNKTGFSYRDLLAQDRWEAFTPVFGSLTVVGATNYTGRLCVRGKLLKGQVQFSAATSVASVAGTDYLTLPMTAQGVTGFGLMSNLTTNIAVGNCHINTTLSRCYLPSQIASANVFTLYFEYEV